MIFISYRRSTGSEIALLVKTMLSHYDYDVFLDLHSIHHGNWKQQIAEKISECSHFVMILADNEDLNFTDLENDIFYYEIQTALNHLDEKHITFLYTKKVDVSKTELPADIAKLKFIQGYKHDPAHFGLTTQFLLEFLNDDKPVTDIKPAPAYEEKDEYVFISYSHKDKDRVYPIITRLQKAGYNVWYDEGIKPSQNFSDDIADHIEKCGCFIAFISGNYASSVFCMDELHYAFDKQRKRLFVYLEKTKLPSGVEMHNSSIQHILRYSLSSDDEVCKQLFCAPALSSCKSK